MPKNTTGLNNPAAIAAVSQVASTKQGQKAIGDGLNAVKYMLLIGGVVLVGRYANTKYKEWRADKYTRKNVGNPNLIAAAVIYESFTRFEPSGVAQFILPSVNLWTNESALNDIALQITDIKAVSDAYKTMFDRNLFDDTRNGLDTEEMQKFWQRINNLGSNNSSTHYPIGSDLYAYVNNGITVNIAEKQNGQWKGTNKLYGNYKYGEFIGKVIDTGKITAAMVQGTDNGLVGQNYYILQQQRSSFQCAFNCSIGVVVQNQVTNKKDQ